MHTSNAADGCRSLDKVDFVVKCASYDTSENIVVIDFLFASCNTPIEFHNLCMFDVIPKHRSTTECPQNVVISL